jgi:hypothetical protein
VGRELSVLFGDISMEGNARKRRHHRLRLKTEQDFYPECRATVIPSHRSLEQHITLAALHCHFYQWQSGVWCTRLEGGSITGRFSTSMTLLHI